MRAAFVSLGVSCVLVFLGLGGCASNASPAIVQAEPDADAAFDAGSSSDAAESRADVNESDATISPDAAGAPGDPAFDGPVAYVEEDATYVVPATGHTVPIHVARPTAAGVYPLVILAHGFSIPVTQYAGYLKRLASFGYIALTVDFPTSFLSDNTNQSKDLRAGIDWAKAQPKFGAWVDDAKIGMAGHSLGGKLALLAATQDARVKAVFAIDPVDGGNGSCNAPECVLVAPLLSNLSVPTAFIGETIDSSALGQACAPAAVNFQTFYSAAESPSLQVTVAGAGHFSFLDNVAGCGFTCSFCNPTTASNGDVVGIARAYAVAFFERRLRGLATYDDYLTGAIVQSRYVASNRITIESK